MLVLFVLASSLVNAQMNFQDSSAQAISYWSLGEKYEYAVSLQKLQFTETDTAYNETIRYEVEVSVIDSTENSYTIRWFYKNFTSDAKNPVVQKLAKIAEDISVDIKTDELGVIQSVENWEEVRDYMAKSFDTLIGDLPKSPEMDKIFNQMKRMYATKSSIEATAIQDAQQFHNFHGGKFTLHETVTGQIKTPNLYDNDRPFDTDVSVTLEELDAENNQYIIRSIQEVNSEQLTETTFKYLKEMTEGIGGKFMEREEFMDLTNVVETVSRIHNTGWVLESVLWKEVKAEGTTNMEIRRIEMK